MTDINKTTDIRCRGIIIYDDKILVVKHSSKSKYYALPGGHLDWGESVLDCMSREIIEELGIKPKIGRLLYVRNYIDNNMKQSIEFHFEITNSKDYLKIEDLGGTHRHELAEIYWMKKNDTKNLKPKEIQIDFNNNTILSDIVKFS